MNLEDLREFGLPHGRINRATYIALLESKYPGFNWEKMYLLRGRYGQQQRLERAVSSLFLVCPFFIPFHVDVSVNLYDKGETININDRTQLVHPETGEALEIDIFLPSLKLAIEFQVFQFF